MTVGEILAFNAALLAAIVTPGPALLVAIRTTLSSGRRAGMAVGFGLGAMAATWTLAALLGLDAIFRLFPWVYATVRTLGALYLLYVAIRIWQSANSPADASDAAAGHAVLQGLMINLLNPKSVLFAAAVLVVVFPRDMSLAESALVVSNHFFVELVFYGLLASFISSPAVSQRYLKVKPVLDRGAAVVLGGLGLRLIASR